MNIAVPMLLEKNSFWWYRVGVDEQQRRTQTKIHKYKTQTKVHTRPQELPELFWEWYELRIRQQVISASNEF